MSVTEHKKYKCEKRMGYKTDKKINFDNLLGVTKAVQKLNALPSVTPYTNLPKWRMLFSAFLLVIVH